MARLPRLAPVGIPQHVIQRGNNRQVCFCCEDDFIAYAGWLRDYADEYGVEVHAWVFMTNHVHLLVTPLREQAVSKTMQALGRMYVRYFNRAYRRSGTLWEGRYKSCLVQVEEYLLQCYRYIELNPVRAGMVQAPADYFWSSFGTNGLGRESGLVTPHAEYLKLGRYPKQRRERYRGLFAAHMDPAIAERITLTTNRGLALGNDRFRQQIEQQYQRRVTPLKAGRPRLTASG
ncbi:transposase [Microbulbifer yueqingensis]|uniref:Putative transposase n=1 Tax=Microbulbifer yueqingensis TaxID=658219 RepID=A0A1G9DLG8_9GAMM|nr:transposase [Microbulbifer yueqingensis]SDK64736.1 putative transposase [Microbulbifer yueqingensis]